LITPRTRKPSSQANAYLAELVAEWSLGEPLDDRSTGFMERGTAMEHEAAAWYAFETDTEPASVGLCLRDDGRVGCSPDRLVGDDGLLEIKVPSAAIHAGYLLNGGLEEAYRPQVQGALWICERSWVHLVAYNPRLPAVLLKVERDEEFIESLAEIVDGFVVRLDEAREQLRV
jgi:hypothetical protein